MENIINTTGTDVNLDINKDLPSVVTENDNYKIALRNDPSVKALTNELDVQDTHSILQFGQKPSEEISKISDELLSQMQGIRTEEIGDMLSKLTKIMDKFDIEEIDTEKEDKESWFQKMFNSGKNKLDKLFQKYDNMGKSVDEIYVLLRQYESEINQTNDNLKRQFSANVSFFEQLEKYIVAGEMGVEEIERYEEGVKSNTSMPEEQRNIQLAQLSMAKDMLSQRVYDLRTAEQVALQTCPMIQTMQMSNFNLLRKINSSFIITLPIFKQCIISAIQLKKQSIQAKSIKQLDDKTNELLQRNAHNTAAQSVNIAKMAGGSSIRIDTLKETYNTIKKGIEDTRQINAQIAMERKNNTAELEAMKQNVKSLPPTASV